MNPAAAARVRVLLAGDVGSPTGDEYHVGDEAMLYQNVQLYRRAGAFDVTILSWARSHGHLAADEQLLWEMPTGAPGWNGLRNLVGQVQRKRWWPWTQWSPELAAYVAKIQAHDLVHISGGGNLNSLYPRELYSRALLLQLARALNRPALVSGQTIGPFTLAVDRQVAAAALNAAGCVTVRDRQRSPQWLTEIGVTRPEVSTGLDDAFFLEPAKPEVVAPFLSPPRDQALRVGISLHPYPEGTQLGASLAEALARALGQVAAHLPLDVYFIPHLLVRADRAHDVPYMSEIAARIQAPGRLITGTELMAHPEPAKEKLVRGLTAAMDLVIATRYHALVFALSAGVPCLALNYDEYYRVKNLSLLDCIWGARAGDFALEVESLSPETLAARIESVCSTRQEIRRRLCARREALGPQAARNLELASQLLARSTGR